MAADTATRIRQLLHTHLNVDLPVVVKSAAQLQQILDDNPFSGDAHDPKRVFYTLCNTPLADPEGLNRQDFGKDKLEISPQAAYLYIPGEMPLAAGWATSFWKSGSASRSPPATSTPSAR